MKHPSLRTLSALTATSAVALVGAACTKADESGEGSAEPTQRVTDGATLKAGDYSAEGSYTTPGGEERLRVDLSLDSDGTVSAVKVTPEGVHPNSKRFQAKFAGGIADVVVGKPIASLNVDKVAGSSLSSGGFNAALDDIVAQAQG
ncbi:FMN-binding protein [Nocardioides sp. zg-536]|uniref:FMN-binding protein n=1 Tax=Nocardioides faecalis TaxID=2803858 RepID=A0A939BUY7_9ACTN|nr:FMN-binding protein [Nocardioides faecalis]MBM9458982.1 FMN-binding protein [Nocardioides faecalis]QVI57251.1 FMN-binding protein [Nocardioides faecalis]